MIKVFIKNLLQNFPCERYKHYFLLLNDFKRGQRKFRENPAQMYEDFLDSLLISYQDPSAVMSKEQRSNQQEHIYFQKLN